MIAETLNCQSCGAAVRTDALQCEHCGARLSAMVCPGCLRMMFRGSKFCPHCGRPGVEWKPTDSPLPCPRCEVALLRGEAGDYILHECAKCLGLWLDKDTVEHLCRAVERESVAMAASAAEGHREPTALAPIRYVRCPQCTRLMHRVNYAKSSGIVVDVCREHGTWFDAKELEQIVAFIRGGGLDRAREREIAELEARRRRQRAAALQAGPDVSMTGEPDLLSMVLRSSGRFF